MKNDVQDQEVPSVLGCIPSVGVVLDGEAERPVPQVEAQEDREAPAGRGALPQACHPNSDSLPRGKPPHPTGAGTQSRALQITVSVCLP